MARRVQDLATMTMRTEIELFLATLDDLTTADALANLTLEARLCGWSRLEVRAAAHRIRMRGVCT